MTVQVRTVVSHHGIIAETRRHWMVRCTWVQGRFNNVLTTATLLLAVSPSTLTSTWFHFAAGSTTTWLMYVTTTSTRSPARISFSLLPDVQTLAKVWFYCRIKNLSNLMKWGRGAADTENEMPQVSIEIANGKEDYGRGPQPIPVVLNSSSRVRTKLSSKVQKFGTI